MADRIVWIHADNLNTHGPALSAYRGAPAIFVWDAELLQAWQISLKRIVFIYECLLDLPVVIRRGDVAEEVAAFAAEHNADVVAVADSPAPRFDAICNALRRHGLRVEVWQEEPFVALEQEPDLRRFSRYWRQARRALNV